MSIVAGLLQVETKTQQSAPKVCKLEQASNKNKLSQKYADAFSNQNATRVTQSTRNSANQLFGQGLAPKQSANASRRAVSNNNAIPTSSKVQFTSSNAEPKKVAWRKDMRKTGPGKVMEKVADFFGAGSVLDAAGELANTLNDKKKSGWQKAGAVLKLPINIIKHRFSFATRLFR